MSEQEKPPQPEQDMGGEQLVDGTGGGSQNVVDVTRETKGTGRKIGTVIVAVLVLIILALPVAWVAGMLAIIGGPGAPLFGPVAWLYLSLLIVLEAAALLFAYAVLRGRF